MVHSVLCKPILQVRMRSHPEGIDVQKSRFRLVPVFMCANSEGSGETVRMVSYVISTIISWAGSTKAPQKCDIWALCDSQDAAV